MIKNDLGHLNCPFYEQKLENGLNVIFVPRKSELKSGVIYIAQGGYPHDEEINSSKIPFGSAYFLEKMIMSYKTKNELKAMKTNGTSHIDFSYTCFNVDTLGDVFSAIQLVLNKICTLDFNEDDVEKFKQDNASFFQKQSDDPLIQTKKVCLNNLYFNSPIRNGFLPTKEQSVFIHASSLKKLLTKYYASNNMTIMISGDFTPGEVIAKIKEMKVPGKTTTYSKAVSYQEDYSKVNHYNKTLHLPYNYNVMNLGFKFPERKKLYDDYGIMMFESYEIISKVLFTENLNFLKGLHDIKCDLLGVSLSQGGEDTYLLLTMKSDDKNTLGNYLTDYCSRLDKRFTHADYQRVVNSYYYKAIRDLACPRTALDDFTVAYANNLPFTGLVGSTTKMRFANFKNFVALISTYPKATSVLEKI